MKNISTEPGDRNSDSLVGSSFKSSSARQSSKCKDQVDVNVASFLGKKPVFFVYIAILIVWGGVDGARIWGISYYVILGTVFYWFIYYYIREANTRSGRKQLRKGKGGVLGNAINAIGRVRGVVQNFIVSGVTGSRWVKGGYLYQHSFLRLTLQVMVCVHLYVIGVAILDKYVPGIAQSWYMITQPLIDLQNHFSYGFKRFYEILVGSGYESRLGYINHTFVAPIYLSLAGFIAATPKLLNIFKLEVKAHIFYLIITQGKKSVFSYTSKYISHVALYQSVVGLLTVVALDYALIFAATPLTITPNPSMRFMLFAAHENRVEMFLFSGVFPFVIVFNIYYAKMLAAHFIISSKLIRRRLRLNSR